MFVGGEGVEPVSAVVTSRLLKDHLPFPHFSFPSSLPPSLPRSIPPSLPQNYPKVLFVIGANGMGKTTTIGKIAARLSQEANQSVLVAACDTFRAAAVDQLEEWTERACVDIHKPGEGETKPAPVLDSAITKAIEGDYDVLIVDTSGRLSNNVALNEELKKLKRTIADRIPGGPQETLLVLDGAVGRNGVDQAKVWNREVGITGLVITKLDGTARGGVVVSIVRDVGVPVKLIGVGEGISDLRDFNPEDFVDALLGYEVSSGEGEGREGGREGRKDSWGWLGREGGKRRWRGGARNQDKSGDQ